MTSFPRVKEVRAYVKGSASTDDQGVHTRKRAIASGKGFCRQVTKRSLQRAATPPTALCRSCRFRLSRCSRPALDQWLPDADRKPHVYVPAVSSATEALGNQRSGERCGGGGG